MPAGKRSAPQNAYDTRTGEAFGAAPPQPPPRVDNSSFPPLQPYRNADDAGYGGESKGKGANKGHGKWYGTKNNDGWDGKGDNSWSRPSPYGW